MEEKKSIKVSLGSVLCIVLIIILTVALVIVYYLGCIKKNDTITENEKLALGSKTNALASQEDILPNNTEIAVEDAINYTESYYNLFKVKLPKVIGNTKTISELNTKILNEVLPTTYGGPVVYTEIPGSMNKGCIYDYKYIIKNNILVIYIYSTIPEGGSMAPQTGSGLTNVSYYYDIDNDKILSLSEAASKLSLSLNELVDRDNNEIKSYDELEENFWEIVVENDDLKLQFFI